MTVINIGNLTGRIMIDSRMMIYSYYVLKQTVVFLFNLFFHKKKSMTDSQCTNDSKNQ